jgi:hypothetical protein
VTATEGRDVYEVEVRHDRDAGRAEDWVRRAAEDAARVQGIGPAYREADSADRAVVRLRQDRDQADRGSFARVRLTLSPEWAERLSGLEPRALEERLARAAGRVIEGELPRAQGVLAVRYEGRDARPEVQAFLSPRLADGGTAPLLQRGDVQAMEARWDREIQRGFGLARGIDTPARDHALPTETDRLRGELRDLTERFFEVVRARFQGAATQDQVKDAGERAHAAQQALRQHLAPSLDPDRRQRLDVVSLRLEGGRGHLGQLAPKDRDVALERAVRAASAPTLGPGAELRIVHWPEGRDQRLAVVVDPRRQQAPVDLAVLREALVNRLPEHLAIATRQYDSQGRLQGEPGRVVAVPERTVGPAPDIPVRDHQAGEQRQEETRDLAEQHRHQEARHEVRLRVERGAEHLERIPPSARRETLEKAVEAAFPFLAARELKDEFRVRTDGRALEVRVRVPESVPLSKEQLERPLFQHRFGRELQRAVVVHGGARDLAPLRSEGASRSGFAQAVERVLGQREAGTAPIRAPGWDRLSRAIPAPARAVQGIGRALAFVGSLRQAE